MHINSLINILELEFPASSALDGDRIGLQIKGNTNVIHNVIFAYELDNNVVDEALSNNAQMIIVFHPLIFFPLSSITEDERVGDLVSRIIRANLSLYVVHTNFDTHPQGTNNIIAEKINLQNKRFLKPILADNRGMGIIGDLPKEMIIEEFADHMNDIFSTPVRYCKGKSEKIRSCAIIGGSGSSFYKDVMISGVDCFITADLSYHYFHQAKGRLSLIELGHYEMEQFNHMAMSKIFENLVKDKDVKVFRSKVVTNPVTYFPEVNYKNKQEFNIL